MFRYLAALAVSFSVCAVIACSPDTQVRALAGALEGCVCVCSDAGLDASSESQVDALIDAEPDASTDADVGGPPSDAAPDALELDAALDAPPPAPAPLSLTEPWTMTVITAGSTTGIRRGADGVSRDSEGCWVTAWEEGGAVTRACLVAGTWVTETVATGLPGVEDAKAADLDGDGVIDVVSCSDAGSRCYITFRGATNVTVTLTASMSHGRAMQAVIADFDGDGLLDVAFGTRAGSAASPAVIGTLTNPGPALARTGSAWTYHHVGIAGWTMSLEAHDMDGDGDMDLVVSDRGFYALLAAPTVRVWDLNGARWIEHTAADIWVNHRIGPGAGSCPVGNYQCTGVTPGDELFLHVVSPSEVWDCQSNLQSQPTSRIRRMTTTDGWATYAVTVLPPAASVAHCQDVNVFDVDGDGLSDAIVSSVKGNSAAGLTTAQLAASALYWLRAPLWDRGEISAAAMIKPDNVERLGERCLITSEQVEGLGVVAFCPPGASP